MILTSKVLDLMQCPHCQHPELIIGSRREPELECTGCGATYPIVDGIPDMTPPQASPDPGGYRTETLFNMIAGVYDPISPLMSAGIWNCSPLRFIDSENRALGRANGGVYLKAPISTGIVLSQAIAPYHDATIIGVDRSWQMLRRSARRFAHSSLPVQLMRVDYNAMPFKAQSVTSLQSINGIHTFPDRIGALMEFKRCLADGGFLSGTALVRGSEPLVDIVLERFERMGVYPMLRTFELFHKEFQDAQLQSIRYETHGAVMFYCGEVQKQAQLAEPVSA